MNLLLDIVQYLLIILWWVIVIQAVMSVLIAFNVINTYNDFVASLWRALNTITEPIYRPIRRVLPDFGAIDFAPFIVLVAIGLLQRVVIPHFYSYPVAYGG